MPPRKKFDPWIDYGFLAYVTELSKLNKYTVSTLHEDPAAGDAFVIGIEVEAVTAKEAAQKRFQLLNGTERKGVLALLVKPKNGQRATVVPVKKTVEEKVSYKVGV